MYEQAFLPDGRPWPVAGLAYAGFGAVLPGVSSVPTETVGHLAYVKNRAVIAPVIDQWTARDPQPGGQVEPDGNAPDYGRLVFLSNPTGADGWVNRAVAGGRVVLVDATSAGGQLALTYRATASPAVVAEVAGPAGTMAVLAGPKALLAQADAAAAATLGGAATPPPPPSATPTPGAALPPVLPSQPPVPAATARSPYFWPVVGAVGLATALALGFALRRKQ